MRGSQEHITLLWEDLELCTTATWTGVHKVYRESHKTRSAASTVPRHFSKRVLYLDRGFALTHNTYSNNNVFNHVFEQRERDR